MQFWSNTWWLVKKDLVLEWRNKYTFSGILLYLLSIILIIFFTFEEVKGPVWIVLFWIVILFTAVNAIAKSFLQESSGRQLYMYTLVSAQSIILSKIIYNILVMLILTAIALLFYSMSAGYPVVDNTSFYLALLTGSIAFASVFSMISAIASKANNSGTLMAVLAFPILIPVIKILIRISLESLSASSLQTNAQDLLYLFALNILIITLAMILFPYLWRD
ncbi:MAG: ABC transporter permease [Chitinophagales bacterium]|nr:ABC transporter permease [Bacteroidota bacterium]MBP7399641.1 ABC transporter permease [Chitinophagales bacterium]MBK8681811.1 ABC transporter permease [Bacteroidota bacterium]MBP8754596.1 ABC transporter permease [Chitinophagales bacterium]MBP9190355.1 ABC transporter permease [Chitinophagales bacterium]